MCNYTKTIFIIYYFIINSYYVIVIFGIKIMIYHKHVIGILGIYGVLSTYTIYV